MNKESAELAVAVCKEVEAATGKNSLHTELAGI